MTHVKMSIVALALVFVTSCKTDKKEVENTSETTNQAVSQSAPEVSTIAITPLTDSPAYADATLILDTPETMVIPQAGDVPFSFGLENYVLKDQTDSPNAKKLANSAKGQHIHFILNNQPYSAHYDPNFKKDIPEGVHHLVAFLSRSYHESVKNDNSVVVRKLEVGANSEDKLGLDMDAPTLIYSRPKGEYTGADTNQVLLDFFVLNTTLSENGNKVIATINNTEFTITEWIPHVITGLPKGETTIALQLVDADGNVIPGPFNSVKRSIMLKD